MFVRVQHDTSGKRPRWRVQVVRTYRVDGKVKQQLLREIGSAYDEETREQLRAEGELHKLALSERELNGTRPLFSSPTIAEIRRYAAQQAERQLRMAPTSVLVEDLYQVGEQVSAANLVWGEMYSQIGWDQVLTANGSVINSVYGRISHTAPKGRKSSF